MPVVWTHGRSYSDGVHRSGHRAPGSVLGVPWLARKRGIYHTQPISTLSVYAKAGYNMPEDTETEWSMEQISETLLEINDAITDENVDEATLSGKIGYHIFAENDSENAAAGLNKALHVAFDEALQEIHVDAELIREYHGEVTPKTVCAEVERQLQRTHSHGGLNEALLGALGRQMGVEPDYLSGTMFGEDGQAEHV